MAKFINVTIHEILGISINLECIESISPYNSGRNTRIKMKSGDIFTVKESFDEMLRIIHFNTEENK